MHTNGNSHYVNGATRPNVRAIVDRQPPHNLDVERALIGALLVGGRDVLDAVRERVDARDMYDELHARLWAAITERLAADKRVTPALLRTIDAEGKRYAGGLVADATTTINARAYADLARDLAARRRLIAVAQQAVDDAHDDALPLADLLRSTAGELAIVRGSTAHEDAPPPVISRRMSDVDAVPIRWLWPGRFALGKLSIVAGEPGVGKSQLSCALAAAVTTGGGWPDGTRAPLGSVVFVCCEDDAADTMRPRLEAAGADLQRVHLYDWTVEAAGERRHFDVGEHVDALAALVRRIGDVSLIIIDPISAYMGRADSHVVAEVRQALTPLQTMAGDLGPAVVMISHLNKGAAGSSAMARVAGSGAFVAVTRGAWMVGIDPRDGTKRRRVLLPLKTNIGADDRTGFAYRVEPWRNGEIASSHVVFEPDVVDDLTPDDMLQRSAGGAGDAASALAEAEAFLRSELSDGPKSARALKQAAQDAGIAPRTLDRARRGLGVVSRKTGNGWNLELPRTRPAADD